MKYIFGAYGTNNIGDDAIFLGAKAVYPELRQIYVNKSYESNAVWYADILSGKVKFENADELIIGGGGLLHCRQAIEDYLKMARIAKEQGLKVSIQRIGAANFNENIKDVSIELFKLSETISARNLKTCSIITSLGFKCSYERDFAYEMKDLGNQVILPFFVDNRKTIGITTNKMSDEALNSYCNLLKVLMEKVNIVHIPHSRAFVSHANNDVVAGEKIWSNIEIYHADRTKQYKNLQYNSNVNTVLSTYKQLDGMLGMRYHSYIFSELTQTPVFGIAGSSKFKSYFEDRGLTNFSDLPFDSKELEEKIIAWINTL